MPSPNWSDDNELMADLTEALRSAALEQQVIDAARAAYDGQVPGDGWELTRLLEDSELDPAVLVRSSGTGNPRMLVFGNDQIRVELELSDDGIEGQLIPPAPSLVRLLTEAGCTAETRADDLGCFRFPDRCREPVKLACVVGGREYTTGWISA